MEQKKHERARNSRAWQEMTKGCALPHVEFFMKVFILSLIFSPERANKLELIPSKI